jgi:predicted nucleic acid-binding protein
MSKKIYFDTNIYLDYFENRSDKLRPLGEFALSVIQRTFKCEYIIVISDMITKELDKLQKNKNLQELFDELESRHKLIKIILEPEDIIKARKITNDHLHFEDAVHYVISKKANVDILLTSDREFSECGNGVKIRTYETLDLL